MAVVRKYEFDLSFDPPTPAQIARRRAAEQARVRAEAEAAAQAAAAVENTPPPPPPEPTYVLAELQAAEAAARDQGYAEGVAATERLTQARLVEATEALRAQMYAIGDTQAKAMAAVERQAAQLTLLSLRKLLPAYLARSGTQEIEALLAGAFEQALDEPRILVRCPQDLREALEPIIQRTASLAGFDGKLSIIGDPGLAETDCRIEWAEGGIERDTRAFLAAVEKAIGGSAAAALPGPHQTTLPPEDPAVDTALEETAG